MPFDHSWSAATIVLCGACNPQPSTTLRATAPPTTPATVPIPEASTPAAVSTQPVCKKFTEVEPVLGGGYIGGRSSTGDFNPPVVLRIGFGSRPDPFGIPSSGPTTLFELVLAPPVFPRPFSAAELCTAVDSAGDELAIDCLSSGARIRRITMHASGFDVLVSVDGGKPETIAVGRHDESCVRLVSRWPKRDLTALQALWDKPVRPERCASTAPATRPRPISVQFDFRPAPPSSASGACPNVGGTCCPGTLRLLVAGKPSRDLGEFYNDCGMCMLTRFTDVHGVSYGCADDQLAQRIVYQLGDDLFVSAGDRRFERVELPCGSRAAFGVTGRKPKEAERRLKPMAD